MNVNLEEAERLFVLADADNSGALSREEVKRVMGQLNGGVEPSPEELKRAFLAMDKDGNGRIEKHEFLAAMTQWLGCAEDAQSFQAVGGKRVIGSPQGSPGVVSSRKKATLNMASFFRQFAGADGTQLRQRIETYQPPSVALNADLMTILRDFRKYSVSEKLSYFDEAMSQMSVSSGLFVALHNPHWDQIEVALQIVDKFLEVVEVFHFYEEKVELWPLFDQIFSFFTAVDSSGQISEPSSIIRRVAQLLRLSIPLDKQVPLYTLCLKALANYIPGPGFPCSRDSHWHPSQQLTRNIMRHEQLIPSLYSILKEHGHNLSRLDSVQMLEAHAKCLQIFCESWFEIADTAIAEHLRDGVRMLLEAVLAQNDGPVDSAGKKHGMEAFAGLLQNLLGALSVLCGFTHEEGTSNFDFFKIDMDETVSIMSVTGVCIQFLSNCGILYRRQVAMIYISIIWQYLLPTLPVDQPLFATVVNEIVRLIGIDWDMSPAGVQVVVNLIMAASELMERGETNTTSAVYIALWDNTQSNFKMHFRRQLQVGFQGGLTTWPICKACFHVLLLLLERGQEDHLMVPVDANDPMSYFGATVFQQCRFLLSTAEDTHLIIDFLCKCLAKDDLTETLLHVGIIDAFFAFFSRFKINSNAMTNIFNKHVAPMYETNAIIDIIVALKTFLTKYSCNGDMCKFFGLDHLDAAEILHNTICRELRRFRLRMSADLRSLIAHLEELVKMIVQCHVRAGSVVQAVMIDELKIMEAKWPVEIDEAYKLGVARSLPKAEWMDLQVIPLWSGSGIKGFDRSTERLVFKNVSIAEVDFAAMKNDIGKSYKRPVLLFSDKQKSKAVLDQEDLARHLHKFVTCKDSTDKIYVEVYVDDDEDGEVKPTQNYFDMGKAIGISSKEAELRKLLSDAGSDREKLQGNQTVEAFYDYFKVNRIDKMDEDTFVRIMMSPSLGYEKHTATSAFHAFDINHDRSLSMKEIAIGFGQLSSDDALTRLKVLFKIYDVDNNGHLDEEELTDMIVKATGISTPDANSMAKHGIEKQDHNGDGMLDIAEFTQLGRSGVIDLGINFAQDIKVDKKRGHQ